MSAPADRSFDQAARLLDELRERRDAALPGEQPEELLIEGYAVALQLEGTRRRMREQALELSRRELALAARERELREQLGALRARLARGVAARPAPARAGEPRRSLR